MCVRVKKYHSSHFFTSKVGVCQEDTISQIYLIYMCPISKATSNLRLVQLYNIVDA